MRRSPLGPLLLSAFSALALMACASSQDAARRLAVTDEAGNALTTYVVVTRAAASAPYVEVQCPDDAACAGGVTLAAGESAVVKAAGRQTGTVGAGQSAVVLRAIPATTNDDYATGFSPDGREAFRAGAYAVDTDLGTSYAAKFYVEGLDTDAPSVYFQNTRRHPIHYDFVAHVLGRPYTATEFAKRTYGVSERTEMAGTLTEYPQLTGPYAGTVALSFFPSDTLTPAQALVAHRLIEERMGFVERAGTAGRLVYLPAGATQEAALAGALPAFDAAGALALSHEALHGALAMQALNDGVAYGTLRLLTPEVLAATIVGATDILVLPRLPNDLPLVAGTITGELQTPLAHVNVAARSRGTPNLALIGAEVDPRVAPLLGKLVRFEVAKGSFTLVETTLSEAQAYWQSSALPATSPPHDDTDLGFPDFADLGFADALRVGVKAANLAELHRVLPEAAPNGFAVPFGAYQRFMDGTRPAQADCRAAQDDCRAEGREAAPCEHAGALCDATVAAGETLDQHVARLLADPQLEQDAPSREAALDGLRWLMHHLPVDSTFGAALDARVAALVGDQRVRLRSSTNAEDLPNFSGAGLYESHTAEASGERAASLRIREVWASVWRWKAFEERRFWNIDHRAVRMGVAVHRSFPDEAANGVLITQNIVDPLTEGMYVNAQLGELSVTNPEDGATPEIFSIVAKPGGGVQAQIRSYSSLSPDASVLSEQEIAALFSACLKARSHFAPLYGVSPLSLALDIEFKLTLPERALVLKQARPFATP